MTFRQTTNSAFFIELQTLRGIEVDHNHQEQALEFKLGRAIMGRTIAVRANLP